MEAVLKKLEADQKLIARTVSALAILYKRTCLVDKSKFDAVKNYLLYKIDQARIENRNDEVKELAQEMFIFLSFRHCIGVNEIKI